MTPIDRIEPVTAGSGIITRSDRVPTEYERYGIWARKFFGSGYQQTHNDDAVAPPRQPGAATLTPTRH